MTTAKIIEGVFIALQLGAPICVAWMLAARIVGAPADRKPPPHPPKPVPPADLPVAKVVRCRDK